MGWSVKRRLFYLVLVVAAILLAAGSLWYRSRPLPSCSDGVQNQNELDIDCGGPCASVCPFEVKSVKEVWSRVFKVDTDRYDAVTFLKNPNRQYGARQLNYRVKIFDGSDVLITTKSGQAFLNPGENFLLYNGRVEVGNRIPKIARFEIIDGPIWQRFSNDLPATKVTFKAFTNKPNPVLTAQIENASIGTIDNIQIVAALSDENANAIAVSSTVVEQLAQGEKREIVFTWPKSLAVDPTYFDFYPHFDPARVI